VDTGRYNDSFPLSEIFLILLTCNRQKLTLVARKRFTKNLARNELGSNWVIRYFVKIFNTVCVSVRIGIGEVNIVLSVLKVVSEGVSVIASCCFFRAA
jgi:hypothetical protein